MGSFHALVTKRTHHTWLAAEINGPREREGGGKREREKRGKGRGEKGEKRETRERIKTTERSHGFRIIEYTISNYWGYK